MTAVQTGALDEITVIDLTRGAAGARATMFMSDHGAHVIRVVDDHSQVLRTDGFRVWDRGKDIVLIAEDDIANLSKLISSADVVIEDFRPVDRPALLSASNLAAGNPHLVTCSITAYGETGPLRDEPAIDDLVLARLGILAGLPGFRDGPVHAAHPLPSVGAGLLAALGIAAALYEREETGTGRHVATSLVAGALLYHPKVIGDHLKPNVFQSNPYGSAPFYSVHQCADGQWIQLGCVHHGFIARAAELMGLSGVLDDPVYDGGHTPKTPKADTHLRKLVADVMITRTAAQWISDFERLDIPFALSQTTDDGMSDLQVAHNEMIVRLQDPEVGAMDVMGSPIKMSATPSTPKGPRVGEAQPVADWKHLAAQRRTTSELPSSPPRTLGQNKLPLEGVRVLEITNLIAGPIAGRLLADIGADVIKLEPPTGDISRPIGRTYFYSINTAKRSIAVDTARDEGKAVVQRLAKASDVVLANLRPGATTRMGLGVDANPEIIETQISGYGLSGPYAHRPGIDPLAQALIGLERAQGGDGNPPSFTAQLAPTDFTTGTMAALGTVLALFAKRRRRADGQRIEVNLLDGGIMLSSEWFTRFEGKGPRSLADQGQHGPGPFHRLYACQGGYLYAAADQEYQRSKFMEVLQLDRKLLFSLVTSNKHANDKPLAKAAEATFAKLSMTEASDLLAEAGIPFAPALPPESEIFFDDPHTSANGWSTTRSHPTLGSLTAVCRYIKFNGAEDGRDTIRPTPLLGQQTDEILREAGFGTSEIAQLTADNLVLTKTTGP